MVISGDQSEPFWEDSLFAQQNTAIIKVGQVELYPVKQCERCPVPPRDPDTGIVTPEFM